MSPIFLEDKLNIKSVAVIGAGPCGLAAAKYLAAERKFNRIKVFEQRATVGGVWNHTPLTIVDRTFSIPRTRPAGVPDTAVWTQDSSDAQFVSPVYDMLETNIPHTLMNYSDQGFPSGSSLFPKHAVVTDYLRQYAEDLRPMFSLSTQVVGLSKTSEKSGAEWTLRLLDLETGSERSESFDAVMVANGHYNDCHIPEIPGLADFNLEHPNIVTHSKFYRQPDQYSGKRVVVVGNSASGIDLSAQIGAVCQQPILVSEKESAAKPAETESWRKLVPEIAEFVPADRAVRFSDGSVEANIDAVVFCTGYFYSFPFLDSTRYPLSPDGIWVRKLYEHILYIEDPTLAFLGIPQRIVPFPVAEAQAAFVARAWADRLALPCREEMLEWERCTIEQKGEGKFLHNLAFPRDVEYINRLYKASMSAKKVDDLENGGSGKIPPHWGADKAWVRERFPAIKVASRALGDKRHEVRSLEELGFDYQTWKLAQDANQKIP